MSKLQDLLSRKSVRILVALGGVALIVTSILIANEIGGNQPEAGGFPTVTQGSGRPGAGGQTTSRPTAGGSGKGSAGPSSGQSNNGSGSGSGSGGGFGPINADLVAYLGCSQTTGSVEGYHMDGGTHFWPNIDYGGGAVSRWAGQKEGGRYWGQFTENMQARPASIIWWQLCILSGNDDSNYQDAQEVLAQLRRDIPAGSTIYVSAQNDYTDPNQCGIGPPNAPEIAQAVADRLVANDGVRRGPKMSTLSPSETNGGCHPNDAGREKFGHDLLAFFG
jgi:hypothetical protein